MRNKYCCLLLVLLAGCGSTRAAREAQQTTNIPAGERTVTAAEIGLTNTTTLTLEQALSIALTYHPSIIQSKQSFLITRKQFQDAIAGRLPSIDSSLSANIGTGNTEIKSSDNENDSSYSAGLSLSQLIYDFDKTPASIRQSYENQLAAESNLRAAENEAAYNVRQAFYNLVKQEALVKVAEESEQQYQVRLNQAKRLVEVGRRIKYDLTKAEVDLGNARLTLVNARNNLKTARAVLNNTLGLAEEPGYRIQSTSSGAVEEFNYDLTDLIKLARQNQPELIAQTARVRAASAGIDKAVADLFPSLSLSGSYNWAGENLPLVWNWALSPALGFNIFKGFKKTSQIDQAVAGLKSARAKQSELEQKIYLDLSRAMAQLADARERLSITRLIVRQSEENLKLVQESYKIGKASSVELTDALVTLTNAQTQLVQAQFDYQIAFALIKKTIGEK
ncbi:MAG: TolC family protein [Planctomycetota bacterium]